MRASRRAPTDYVEFDVVAPAPTLVACSRMYNVAPGAHRAWADLFDWLSAHSGVSLEVIEHPAPAPLSALWARPDLGCVFMCGWPFARASLKPLLVAAPLPVAARYRGRPIYFTDLVVHADSDYRRLEDTFGGRLAWTAETSHSGFNALRHHLLPHFLAAGRPLYASSVGPLVTPLRALEAVLGGTADLAPLDSYAMDLLGRHAPDRLSSIRVLASTDSAPMPPLVASRSAPTRLVERLTDSLLGAHLDPALQPTLDALSISGFAAVSENDYTLALAWEAEALAAGYARPA